MIPNFDPQVASGILWFALFLFVLRVLGQVLVVLRGPRWLPPMQQWQSGLLPYPVLFGAQVLIIVLMAWVSFDFSRGGGAFVEPANVVAGWIVVVLSLVYFAGMVVRYALRMKRHPDQRWLGGTIPIVFHCVLASFLFVVGAHHAVG